MPTSLEQLVLLEKRAASRMNGVPVELGDDVKLLCRVLDKRLTALEMRQPYRAKTITDPDPERKSWDCA